MRKQCTSLENYGALLRCTWPANSDEKKFKANIILFQTIQNIELPTIFKDCWIMLHQSLPLIFHVIQT